MNNRSLSTGALIAALMIVMPNAWATHRAEAEEAIAAAKAAHDTAMSAKVAAPESAAMIQEAEELLPLRQYTKAVELADKARRQDSFAYQQSTSEKGAGADADADSKAKQAIVAAEAARKKAASVGGEWRDTAQLIKDAEGLAKSGKYDEAIQLANQAARQGALGYEQSLAEKGVGFPAYMAKKP
ncbi:hypothetical protein [uncultured Thiocystis sp.]|jgi:hypothetical protein|uniref:hypothetical protein n=1 Tax=uncultured Thiocystis sp. TaxID=1202134 RepID=UPI0025CF4EA7|nr:hypothetical protein [uncultured Thiocystis sp.]